METKSKTEQSQYPTDRGWSEVELEKIELGDVRLERRLRRTAESLSRQPEYPINVASEDSAATKAAYRLFDNEKLTAEAILEPHRKKTVLRMQSEPLVLAIQDTSIIDFTSHKKTQGLGPTGRAGNVTLQGLILHSSLAVTPQGLPLGLLSHECWAREGLCHSEQNCQQRAFENKESYKWVRVLKEVAALPIPTTTKVVHVADRECDIYEFLRDAEQVGANYLVRACYDRLVEFDEYETIQTQIRAQPCLKYVELDVPSEKRKAILELRFTETTIRAPKLKYKDPLETPRPPIRCWIVNVIEPQPPSGEKALSWTLITNVGIYSENDALERLDWYRRRWSIEEYHKILKSGCSIEDCRLQTADRLKRFIALFCVIGWRIFWMVHISRADTRAPAALVLTSSEIGTLCSLERFHEKKISPGTLTVRQAVAAIGALGGHLWKKSPTHPGATAVWRGWQRLSSMLELYNSMEKRCGY